MKVILLACLLVLACCEESFTYHYKGDMIVNKQNSVKVSGPIYIDFLKTINVTLISGMHMVGSVHTPFGLISKLTSVKMEGGKIDIEGTCMEGGWGENRKLFDMEGTLKITGTHDKIHYVLNCTHKPTELYFKINADGVFTKCPYYLPPEAAKRAHLLVGESTEKYQAHNVLNWAMLGYPYFMNIKNCSIYLTQFTNVTEIKPGFLVIGKDGAHCGVFDREGDKFIHSNPATKKVSDTPNSQLKTYFPKGYVLKEYKC